MRIYEAAQRGDALLSALLRVWEASVRATHTFLSEAEIERIKAYVPRALRDVEHLVVAEETAGVPAAFMGTENGRLEMLFLAPEGRGKGFGKRLVQLGIRSYGVTEVMVNEQNPQAVGFYTHLGFRTYRRTEHDEQGGDYPLLYLKL